MTVPSTTRRAGPFTGTGALVAYPFDFKVFAKQDLAVTIADSNGLETDLVLDSTFTVTLNVDQEATPGGTVNYAVGGVATALPTGYTLVVTGDGLEFEQTADLPQGGNFSPVVIENALDRAVMLLQRLWDGVRRSMRLPDTASDNVSTVLPVPTANSFIGWDSNGTALRNVDPNTLATVVAFAAWQSQAFNGDGITTQFTLSSDPGSVNNLDVVVGAVPQRNDVDFTLSGTTLTFDVAPANGLSIFCRWGQALPEGTSTLQPRLASTASAADGAGLVGYLYSLAYAPGKVGYKLNQLRTPQDLGTAIPGTSFAIGPEAGSVTTGIGNLAVGYRTLTANTTGQYSTALGANNQYFANGLGFNTSVGYGTAYNLTTGYSNVAMGFEALHDCQAGTSNCVVGYSAQHYGLANGGVRDTHNVTAFGTFACQYNQADSTVGIGLGALKVNTGSGNVACGNNAAVTNTSGAYGTFVGESAGANRTVGEYDTFVGFQAGYTQSTSIGYNTVVGALAGYYNTTAAQNVLIGYAAGQGTSGSNGGGANVAIGNQAMQLCTAVSGNVAIGNTALRNVTGATNVAIGSNAGLNVTSGAQNALVGTSAGYGISTASYCSAIGRETLTNLNGDYNTAVGYNAGSTAAAQTYTNTCSLGNGAVPTGSNQVTLGNTSIATIRAQVTTITAISDARDKKDIQPLADLLPDDFLDEVEAVAYRWAMRDGTDRGDALHAGVIAQQLKAVQDRHGLQWLKLVDESDPNRLEATPGNLLMPLVVSAQRMRAQLSALAERVAFLERKSSQ